MGEDGVDRGVSDWLDRPGLSDVGASLAESFDGFERVDFDRQQFFGGGPTEQPDDPPDPFVDLGADEMAVDEPLADRRELERSGFPGRECAILLLDRPDRLADLLGLVGLVLTVYVGDVPLHEFVDVTSEAPPGSRRPLASHPEMARSYSARPSRVP